MKNRNLSTASGGGVYRKGYMLLALFFLLFSIAVAAILGQSYFSGTTSTLIFSGKPLSPVATLVGAGMALFGCFLFVTYLTKGIAALDRLRNGEAGIGTILETMLDAVVTIDVNGKVMSVNKEAEKVFGYSGGELLGKDVSILMPEADGMKHTNYLRKNTSQYLGKVISENRSVEGVRKDGAHFPIELSVNMAEINGEKVFIGVVRDVSETVRNEKALLKALLDAEKANVSKLRFLATMSHEIRTPMSGMLGMLHLLRNTTLSAEQRRFLEMASGSGELLLSVINDVLDLSKMNVDKLKVESIPFNVISLVEETAVLLSGPAQKKGLELVCCVDGNVPALLQGDPTRIRQILANLLNNAIKFTDVGEVSLCVSMKSEKIYIRVTDTGLGMTEAEQQSIFDEYQQADVSTSRKYGGTGLGLPICKRLIEMMGGEIHIDSIPGKGSVFSLSIPMAYGEQIDVEKNTVEVQTRKVLVADKSIASAEAIKHALMSFGVVQVDVVNDLNGLENKLYNLEANNEVYDVVFIADNLDGLLDFDLPGRLSAGDAAVKPRVVMLGPQSVDKRKHPDVAWLTKPVRRVDMYACLSSVEIGLPVSSEGLSSKQDFSGNGVRVLLVEDNEISQEVAKEILSASGFLVDVVDEGAKAVNAVQHGNYDALLMDIQMPIMDGFEATQKIRALGGDNLNLPIIAMTASALSGDKEKSLAAGMNDHIAKPINPDEVVEILSRWIKIPALKDAKSNKTAMIDISTLPTLPGIKLESAMDRFCGDWGLYKNILISFSEKHADTPDRIEEHIARGDWQEAARIAHNLSGTSGNLDAFFIHNQARAIEEVCRVDKNAEKAQILLVRLNECVAEVVAGVDAMLATMVNEDVTKAIDVFAKVDREILAGVDEAYHLVDGETVVVLSDR